MKRPFTHLLILLSTCLATACSGHSGESGKEPEKIIEKADSPAYRLGQRHATELLDECKTTNDIRNRLLDLRAREHIIRTQIRPSAADAYIEGIEMTIRNSGDTLATAIL